VRIQVELFATLGPYRRAFPAEASPLVDVPPGATADDVAALLGIPPDLPRITLVNGQDAVCGQSLREGDVVSMFPPLAGGQAEKILSPPAVRSR
jgi:molybdopterin converting factor small subunit